MLSLYIKIFTKFMVIKKIAYKLAVKTVSLIVNVHRSFYEKSLAFDFSSLLVALVNAIFSVAHMQQNPIAKEMSNMKFIAHLSIE